jgi:DNA-binding NarL/FixJ family response regulator
MSANRNPGPIRIGLMADEPIRLAGLASIFDQPARDGHAGLVAVPGPLSELLAGKGLKYLVVDLNSSAGGLKTLEEIRSTRPDIRLIVIGPGGDEELVLTSIIAGARAYLDLNAGPEMVRMAIEVVTEGSIWAPRRLLSKLIDRLLKVPEPDRPALIPKLTIRERQVLELIMLARSNREIAKQLGIEERTVRAHLGRLMRKAGVDNRIKLSMSARSLFGLTHGGGSRGGRPERARRLVTK